MKEYVATTQGQGLWPSMHFGKGIFWPTMHQDAKRMTKTCKVCKSFSDVPTQPPERLTAMSSL